MRAEVEARGVGVRFLFDRQRRVVTPGHSRLLRRGSETWGVREMSFRIGPGEGVALIGATGSGKTTLLRLIGGVLPADEGEVEARGRVGTLLSIDAGLMPTLTGRENALLLGVLSGLSRAEARASLDEMQHRSRLGVAFDRPASSYSQGMRARLAFTAATAARPDLIILDEVHEAFDHAFREVLESTAREVLDSGGILVAAGHDHDILARLCPRALFLEEGRLRGDGPFADVRRAYLGNGGQTRGPATAEARRR